MMTMTTGIQATQIDQFGISLPVVLIGPIQRQIGGLALAAELIGHALSVACIWS